MTNRNLFITGSTVFPTSAPVKTPRLR